MPRLPPMVPESRLLVTPFELFWHFFAYFGYNLYTAAPRGMLEGATEAGEAICPPVAAARMQTDVTVLTSASSTTGGGAARGGGGAEECQANFVAGPSRRVLAPVVM